MSAFKSRHFFPATRSQWRLSFAQFLASLVVLLFAAEAVAATIEGRRAALVIGNSAYETLGALPNAANDAERMGEVLREANFEVTVGQDLDKQETEKAIRDFLRTLNDGDVALFYYSGHAVQVAGENFILPVDASLSSAYDLEVESYKITNLLDYMRETSSLQILVLDSCRDNPFKDAQFFLGGDKVTVAAKDGLASLTPRQGSLIVYSTAPDQVAYDGGGDISPFTGAFTDHILTPNAEVRQILTEIRAEVIERTNGRQVPWDVSSLTSQFFFVSQQNVLIVGESLGEVRVSPEQTRVDLGIMPPISSGGMKLTAKFEKLPAVGDLYLDDLKLTADTEVDADRIQDVVYVSEPGEKPVELISYTISADTGKTVDGVVAIVFDPAIKPEQDEESTPGVVIATAPEPAETVVRSAAAEEKLEPIQVALASDIGTGFELISDALPRQREIPEGWLRLESRSPSAQVALESEMLIVGDLVPAAQVAQLAVRPALYAEDAEVVLSPVNGTGAPVIIGVDATVNRCDELAADRLDIQAVAEGVFPNDLRADEAIEACRRAVDDHPDIARFRHQLGRALYAKGEYEGAIAEFTAALEAGHVRSGDVLGRLHQYGGGVQKDPAKAIPMFEIAAARGDPYAQHSLAKALIEGTGVEVDVDRSLEFYGKAVEAGHTYAMNGLGSEYLSGEHVAKDLDRAYSLFAESADRGDVWGKVNLAFMYRDGLIVQQDTDRAKALLMEAHEGLHPYAGTVLALMMQKEGAAGSETLRLFRESAARGDAFGAYYAAEIVRSDSSLASDEREAVRLYALAASRPATKAVQFAKAKLNRIEPRLLNIEIQETLVRLGADGVEIDGQIGPRTREAATTILGKAAPAAPQEILVELIGHEWLTTKPRLDML